MVGRGAGSAEVFAIGLLSVLATSAACGSRGAALMDGATTCSVGMPPPGAFTSVVTGDGFACGIRGDGTVACWGDTTGPATAIPAGPFSQVAFAHDCGCGLGPSGALACWACGTPPVARAPGATFQDVGVGEADACARHDDGSIVCWNASYVPPPNTYLSLSMGAYYACAIEPAARAAVCWDPRAGAGHATTTQGPFQQVAAARFAACGIRMD